MRAAKWWGQGLNLPLLLALTQRGSPGGVGTAHPTGPLLLYRNLNPALLHLGIFSREGRSLDF